jgi:S1-C subfamily serine protease
MSPIPATLRATDRRAVLAGGAELAALALDAGVDPAASGAPVVNTAGDVLGVITTTVTAAPGADPGDRAFAIPVDIAREATFAIVDRA